MTPEQINIAIAEHCGWRRNGHCSWYHPQHGQRTNQRKEAVPNYHGDLNAMHEVEKVFTKAEDRKTYLEHAVRIVCRDNGVTGSAFFATAGQRAEAFLRTVGK